MKHTDFSWCYSVSRCFHSENLNENYIYFAFLISVVLMSVGKWKKRLLQSFIYQHLPTERNPGLTARISEVEISKGGVPTETILPFLLALLQTNVQSHPSPASTDTYAWFQKGWRSCVLKEVTLRHTIKHIQKSEQDQKLEQLYPGIPQDQI